MLMRLEQPSLVSCSPIGDGAVGARMIRWGFRDALTERTESGVAHGKLAEHQMIGEIPILGLVPR